MSHESESTYFNITFEHRVLLQFYWVSLCSPQTMKSALGERINSILPGIHISWSDNDRKKLIFRLLKARNLPLSSWSMSQSMVNIPISTSGCFWWSAGQAELGGFNKGMFNVLKMVDNIRYYLQGSWQAQN